LSTSDATHVLLKTTADEQLSDDSATRFACQNETKALELITLLTMRSPPPGQAPVPGAASASAADASNSAVACQLCRKRKVKARVVLDGKVTLLCKACTLEQMAKHKEDNADNDENSGSGASDEADDKDGKEKHHRRHHRHHHGHHKHGARSSAKDEPHSAADAAVDAKERSKQHGFAVHKTEADMYAWSSSEDEDGKTHTPRKLKVTISERSRKHRSSEKDETALEETAKSLSMRNTPVTSPNKEAGDGTKNNTPPVSRRRQPRQRKEDFSVLLVPSGGGDGGGASTSVLDLFDLSMLGGGAALADVGDELLVPEVLQPTSNGSSSAAAAASFPNLDDLLSAPLVSAAPVQAAAAPVVVPSPAIVTPAPASAIVSNEPESARLMRLAKASLDGGDLATALGKATECVSLVNSQMQTADALGKATLEPQLAYAAKYVSLLRLTKQTMAIGAPSVPSKRASALAVIAAGIRVSAEHRAKAVRAAILRCGASKDYHTAATLLRLLLSTNPPDAATLDQQLAKCESEGETNATLPLSPTELYCAASLEPLEHGRALRCKACGLHYSLESKMMSEACGVCELNELEACTL
jgi:hypothetical protein